MPKHWQAAAWWLERRCPRDWGRRERARGQLQIELEAEARRMAHEFGLSEEVALEEARASLGEGRQPA